MDLKRKFKSIKCFIYCKINILLQNKISEAHIWTGSKTTARLLGYLQSILIFCVFNSAVLRLHLIQLCTGKYNLNRNYKKKSLMQLKEQFKGSVSVCIEITPAAQLQRASMSCGKDIAHKTSGSSKSRGTQIY